MFERRLHPASWVSAALQPSVLADVPEPDALWAQLELRPWEARVRRHP